METEQKLQHIDPQLFWLQQHFFLILRSCSTGGHEGPALCWVWFSLLRTATTNSKLTELPVGPGYIIVWRSPASCELHICTEFNPSTVKAIPWYLRPDTPVSWLPAGSICYTGLCSSLTYVSPVWNLVKWFRTWRTIRALWL